MLRSLRLTIFLTIPMCMNWNADDLLFKTIYVLVKCLYCFRYLAHLYAGEALIKLNQVSDALKHLNPDQFNQDLNILSADICEKAENSSNDSNASTSSVHKETEKITNSFKGDLSRSYQTCVILAGFFLY